LAAVVYTGFYIESRLSNPRRLHRVVSKWARRQMAVSGVRVTVRGKMPEEPCVIVANHQSLTDTPILLGFLGVEFRFIAKSSLFQIPIIGSHLRRGGHVAVVREDARGAIESLAAAERILREQRLPVVVFAEGTRSTEGLQEFKSGAAHLAIQAQVPVIPVALDGTAALLRRGEITVRSGEATVTIGEPIPTAGLTRRDRDALTGKVREAVAALLGRNGIF
jgi:1-acyl-sn-glycerol-3-phosphate acyltransferase